MSDQDLIKQLEFKIKSLEEEAEYMLQNSILGQFSKAENRMIDIIGREMKRMDENSQQVSMDKDDVRKFDTLVKDFVALRGKIHKMVEENEELEDSEVAELIKLVQGGSDE